MKYKKFRCKVCAVLIDFYGQDAEVVVVKLLTRNRKTEYGLLIQFEDADSGSTPVICLKGYYREYCHCGNWEKCIGEIIEKREEQSWRIS